MGSSKPNIHNKEIDLRVGGNTYWGHNVTFGTNCRKCSIGFGCTIGRDIYIDVEELWIGDYTTIHHGSILHGKKCHIGHNNWIGHYCL
ncbi:MAG: hypothetical protein JRD05_13730, partial [Deltaproteobacteria bacterium]|nr:hypothetical protein [Deltaproteobacteria bacterium]